MKLKNANRHQFLIGYFFNGKENGYEIKTVGNWVLVKQWNRGSNRWEVAVWQKDTFQRIQDMSQAGLFD